MHLAMTQVRRNIVTRDVKRTSQTKTTLCLKNDTDFEHYNFNKHQAILVNFGTDVSERVCYRIIICYSTSPN